METVRCLALQKILLIGITVSAFHFLGYLVFLNFQEKDILLHSQVYRVLIHNHICAQDLLLLAGLSEITASHAEDVV